MNASAPHLRTAPHTRWLVLCLIALILSAAPSGLLHFVVVAHNRCAEHGDVVHGEHDRHAIVAATDAVGQTRLDRQAPQDDQHAHCSTAMLGRDEATPPPVDPVRATDPCIVAPTVLTTVWLSSQRQLHRTAPKQSPPTSMS